MATVEDLPELTPLDPLAGLGSGKVVTNRALQTQHRLLVKKSLRAALGALSSQLSTSIKPTDALYLIDGKVEPFMDLGWSGTGENYYFAEALAAGRIALDSEKNRTTAMQTGWLSRMPGCKGVVKLRDAIETIHAIATDLNRKVKREMQRVNNYRSWIAWKSSNRAVSKALGIAIGKLESQALPQNKAKGPRFMSVNPWTFHLTNPAYPGMVTPYGLGRHGSYWAQYRRPGRPALSEAAWIDRYLARIAKRSKGAYKRKGKIRVKIPPTKYPRPKRTAKAAR